MGKKKKSALILPRSRLLSIEMLEEVKRRIFGTEAIFEYMNFVLTSKFKEFVSNPGRMDQGYTYVVDVMVESAESTSEARFEVSVKKTVVGKRGNESGWNPSQVVLLERVADSDKDWKNKRSFWFKERDSCFAPLECIETSSH